MKEFAQGGCRKSMRAYRDKSKYDIMNFEYI